MRIIKLAFLSFLVFFVILTGISLFIPSHIRLAKVVNIEAEKDSIFTLIKNKDEWKRWHPAFAENGGNEQETILQNIKTNVIAESDSLLLMQWQQKGKRTIENGWQLHHSGTDSTALQWYMDFYLSWYPWQKFGSLFYENNYGQMMERGLYNLKREVEK